MKTKDKDLVAEKVLKCYRYSREQFKDAIANSEESMNYVNNQQWTASDRENATKHGKPALSYNLFTNIISILLGNEQLNRNRVLIKPNSTEGVNFEMANIMQGRWNAINDEQNIEESIQTAFTDGLICSMGGWIQRTIKLNDEGYLDFNYDVVNNMRVYPDPKWRVADTQMKSCNFIVKEGYETIEYIKHNYDISDAMVSAETKVGWWKLLNVAVKMFKEKGYSTDREYDKENDRYQILEMEERVVEKVYICSDGENIIKVLSKDFDKYKKEYPALERLTEQDDSRIHLTTIIPALKNMIVYDKDSYSASDNFSLFPVHSFRYNMQATEVSSLVDQLKDIQDDINKGKSQVRDFVTQMLSGALYIDQREQKAKEILDRKGNQPGLVIPLSTMNNMPKRVSPETMPPEVVGNIGEGLMFSDRISSINAGMRGQSEKSGESGVLFEQKIERASAAINPYYKNISILRKNIGKDFIDNFAQVYSDLNRPIRIRTKRKNTGEMAILNYQDGEKTINNVINRSFYVEMDEGNDNLTVREDNFEKFLALTNVISQAHPEYIDYRALVEAAPIPNVEKWLEYIDQQMQQGGIESNKQMQLEKTKEALENRSLELGNLTQEQEYLKNKDNKGENDGRQVENTGK